MARATSGHATHRKKKRILKDAAGFRGARKNRWRIAKEAVRRAEVYATRDRRARKRDFRALWVTRLSAACDMRGIAYNRFISGLLADGIELNRKMMSEIAIHSPADFDLLVAAAKKHAPKMKAVA
ncbi:MAG: 50S ribosomal protein L20 [Phycisphaerales bacterium]|nr:50S ribosomal protein L20 [Phycisphaerales bacterium]